ncbi:MAG: hypothetical protein PVG30_00690 [Gammaproteobacteria bacterium]|jgi:hypothetical protein
MNINNYETKVLKKLYEHSYVYPSLSRGEMFIKEISQSTDFTISLVKKAIVSLRRLKILDVDPTHDIHDLNSKMPFVIFMNKPICNFLKKNQREHKHAQ